MTIVEGQIEPLKRLKEALSGSGITRFSSIGEIDRFLNSYESERERLPRLVEAALEEEIQGLRANLARQQQIYRDLRAEVCNELTKQAEELEDEIVKAKTGSEGSLLYRAFCFLRVKYLSRRKLKLEQDFESVIRRRTSSADAEVARLQTEIAEVTKNRNSIASARCKASLDDLAHTKKVVDGLYALIAGAIGENSVVRTLEQLSDDCYLFNDFSLNFDPPIYNKNEDDRIFSVQIDHLLVCRSGVFLIETKNWSQSSLESLDLRSPVKQILRTNFALFVLLNRDLKSSDINLEHHHWGSRRIPIRNIVVMTNAKPKEAFKHVKVLSLDELNGYVQYFEQLFSAKETESIFEYLKSRVATRP
jgi:hypothetical protein